MQGGLSAISPAESCSTSFIAKASSTVTSDPSNVQRVDCKKCLWKFPCSHSPSRRATSTGLCCQVLLCGFVFAQPACLWTSNTAHTRFFFLHRTLALMSKIKNIFFSSEMSRVALDCIFELLHFDYSRSSSNSHLTAACLFSKIASALPFRSVSSLSSHFDLRPSLPAISSTTNPKPLSPLSLCLSVGTHGPLGVSMSLPFKFPKQTHLHYPTRPFLTRPLLTGKSRRGEQCSEKLELKGKEPILPLDTVDFGYLNGNRDAVCSFTGMCRIYMQTRRCASPLVLYLVVHTTPQMSSRRPDVCFLPASPSNSTFQTQSNISDV